MTAINSEDKDALTEIRISYADIYDISIDISGKDKDDGTTLAAVMTAGLLTLLYAISGGDEVALAKLKQDAISYIQDREIEQDGSVEDVSSYGH